MILSAYSKNYTGAYTFHGSAVGVSPYANFTVGMADSPYSAGLETASFSASYNGNLIAYGNNLVLSSATSYHLPVGTKITGSVIVPSGYRHEVFDIHGGTESSTDNKVIRAIAGTYVTIFGTITTGFNGIMPGRVVRNAYTASGSASGVAANPSYASSAYKQTNIPYLSIVKEADGLYPPATANGGKNSGDAPIVANGSLSGQSFVSSVSSYMSYDAYEVGNTSIKYKIRLYNMSASSQYSVNGGQTSTRSSVKTAVTTTNFNNYSAWCTAYGTHGTNTLSVSSMFVVTGIAP